MDVITTLVCTRDRPTVLPAAVRSLLATEGDRFEFLVVDQSDGPDTEDALRTLQTDARLHYRRCAAGGKGVALNEGLRLARGRIVVCTDDDCIAPPGWVAAMANAVEAHPSAAVVFCNVVAPAYDPNQGYVPAYVRRRSRLLRSALWASFGHGLGAGMALRRDEVLALGGFDESFGPGARFPSGDDWDLANRVLLNGQHVYETADVSILHNGFRTFAQGRAHARRDWLAIGALCAKPLRAGHLEAMVVASVLFTSKALWPPVLNLLRLRRPRGLQRILGFLEGFAAGLRTPMDRRTLIFEKRGD